MIDLVCSISDGVVGYGEKVFWGEKRFGGSWQKGLALGSIR